MHYILLAAQAMRIIVSMYSDKDCKSCVHDYHGVCEKKRSYKSDSKYNKEMSLLRCINFSNIQCARNSLNDSDINAQDIYGNTAIIIAVRENDINLVMILLIKNPDLALQNNKGDSAFSIAKKIGNKDIIALLETVKIKAELNDFMG